jgi:hypothetical protein
VIDGAFYQSVEDISLFLKYSTVDSASPLIIFQKLTTVNGNIGLLAP